MRNFCRIMGTCVVIGVCTLEGTPLASEVALDIARTLFKADSQKEVYQKELSDEQMEDRQSEEQSSMDSSQEIIYIEDPYYRLGQSITTNLWPRFDRVTSPVKWLDQVPSPLNMTYQLWEGSMYYSSALKNSIYYTFVIKIDNIVMDF